MTTVDFLIRICSAFLLGIIIGIERQYRHRMAGIQTNVLVCVGSCLFVMFSSLETTSDRTRIAAQVVTGVGFLGGGVILREGFNVKGLNTAATLWCTAAVGVLTSAGYLAYSAIGALTIVLSNIILRPLAQKIYNIDTTTMDEECVYEINIKCLKKDEFNIRSTLMSMLAEQNLILKNFESYESDSPNNVWIRATVICFCKNDIAIENTLSKLHSTSGIISIGWEVG